MRRRTRHPARHLRLAVETLPRHTKEAMLRGIDANRIIVGAYVDPRSGGICPMLAAHRNGGRTSVASFARAWDAYTGAKRPRRATRREVRVLRSLLESSLASDGLTKYASTDADTASIAELAAQIRAEREQMSCHRAEPAEPSEDPPVPLAPPDADEFARADEVEIRIRRRLPTGDRHRAAELRAQPRWAWMRPARRLDHYKDLLAAAEDELSRQQADDPSPVA